MPADPADFYATLAAALRERLAAIADHALRDRDPAAHLERLKAASQKIAELQADLPANAPSQLGHYLGHCSYDKALALLEQEA